LVSRCTPVRPSYRIPPFASLFFRQSVDLPCTQGSMAKNRLVLQPGKFQTPHLSFESRFDFFLLPPPKPCKLLFAGFFLSFLIQNFSPKTSGFYYVLFCLPPQSSLTALSETMGTFRLPSSFGSRPVPRDGLERLPPLLPPLRIVFSRVFFFFFPSQPIIPYPKPSPGFLALLRV